MVPAGLQPQQARGQRDAVRHLVRAHDRRRQVADAALLAVGGVEHGVAQAEPGLRGLARVGAQPALWELLGVGAQRHAQRTPEVRVDDRRLPRLVRADDEVQVGARRLAEAHAEQVKRRLGILAVVVRLQVVARDGRATRQPRMREQRAGDRDHERHETHTRGVEVAQVTGHRRDPPRQSVFRACSERLLHAQ